MRGTSEEHVEKRIGQEGMCSVIKIELYASEARAWKMLTVQLEQSHQTLQDGVVLTG